MPRVNPARMTVSIPLPTNSTIGGGPGPLPTLLASGSRDSCASDVSVSPSSRLRRLRYGTVRARGAGRSALGDVSSREVVEAHLEGFLVWRRGAGLPHHNI